MKITFDFVEEELNMRGIIRKWRSAYVILSFLELNYPITWSLVKFVNENYIN